MLNRLARPIRAEQAHAHATIATAQAIASAVVTASWLNAVQSVHYAIAATHAFAVRSASVAVKHLYSIFSY
jgi:hypothetical protein